MGRLGKFQSLEFDNWGGTSKLNHLGGIFATQPQMATNLMVQLLGYKYGKTLDTFLSQFKTKEFDSDDEYTWNVIASSTKNLPIVEARDLNGNAITSAVNAGANGEPFYVIFEEDLFAKGAIIVGELNEIYPLRILEEGYPEGTNTRYKVMVSGGITTGIPGEQLQSGKRFSKDYAPVEREFSRKVDDITFASPVAMRNEFTSIRMQHKISGALLNKKIAFGIPVEEKSPNGKTTVKTFNMWMHYEQWELEKQWNEAKNKVIAFGRSNRNANGEYLDIGESGEVIRMGAGLYQQMECSNTMFYNNFSIKLIEDALYSLTAGKLGWNERTFILRTGEQGAIQFHKAAQDTLSGWTALTVNADNLGIVQKVNSPLHQNAIAIGGQIVEYRAPNGMVIKVDVDPYYDDPVRNKIMLDGKPAFSYRYDIFDIGSMNQPNIFKVGVKGQVGDFTSYEWGFRNPFTGQMGNPYMSHDEDSSTVHKYTTTGVCVLDPTRTMSLIPAVLQG